MAHVLTFTSTTFDAAGEMPNDNNPIAGESVLKWLRDRLKTSGYEVSEPATEDWGWYIDASREGTTYLVGASADAADLERFGGAVEWVVLGVVQIHKKRSLKEKLLGRNALATADPLSALVERLIKEDGGTTALKVDREG